jgi:hypothetical protein
MPTFHLPTRPYSLIDGINRVAAATGSPGYAQQTADANYNGHFVAFVEPNKFKCYWTCYYFSAGIHTIGRGSLVDCLDAAEREYDRGALGASASVSVTSEADVATMRARARWVEGEEGTFSWLTPLHKEINHAFWLERHGVCFGAVGLLANSKTVEEFKAKVDAASRVMRQPTDTPIHSDV